MKKSMMAVLSVLFTVVLSASYLTQPSSTVITPSTGTPAFVQAVEAHTTGTPTSLGVNMGTQPVVGNVIIVGAATLGADADSGLVQVSDNQGNTGYSRLTLFQLSGLVPRASLWCGVVVQSSGTYTITMTTPANDGMGITAAEYSGTSCNPDIIQLANQGATSPYACGGSMTPRNARDLYIAFIFAVNATLTTTFTPPTSFTERVNQPTAASGLVVSLSDRIVSATSTFTPTYATGQNHAGTPCVFAAMMSK